jgi:5-formaminoimidazole-4-carboxamide-1-(beta)-D-ribofuranosyl 5'-monophosphate synthetase
LANEFLSIDERRETVWDGIKRMPIDIQQKLKDKEKEGRFKPTFEVTLHGMLSARESLIKDLQNCANAFLLTCMKEEPPGIIGPWCLQTLVTWDKVSKYGYKPLIKVDATLGDMPKIAADYGLYDVPEGAKDVEMHLFVTQDIAVRHGGGANVHMGIGGQYSNAKYMRPMSLGDRTALEIRRAINQKMLQEIVT